MQELITHAKEVTKTMAGGVAVGGTTAILTGTTVTGDVIGFQCKPY